MKEFKGHNEIRRVMFGLSAIISTPVANLPPIINHKLPDFMLYLVDLTKKVFERRDLQLK